MTFKRNPSTKKMENEETITLTKKQLEETFKSSMNEIIGEKLTTLVGSQVADNVKSIVEKMRIDQVVNRKDVSGLTDKQKKDFAEVAIAMARKMTIDTKANEALIEQQDNRGGYLVSVEVAAAILRIAASVGTIISQAQRWDMKTDELGIPNYTGSYLTGAYLGVDTAGAVTGLTFGQALLVAKRWQLAFAIGNDLLADASVNLADWLLAIAGESLANMIDQQGLVGTGAPFVGILNNSAIQTLPLASGKVYMVSTNATTPNGFEVLVDGSNMIAKLEESILDGAAFYMHRTVWAALRAQKDSAGNYILPYAAWAPEALTNIPGGGPIKPAGYILGYPVYTNRWMPTLVTTTLAGSPTQFILFGNMEAVAFGDKGEMRVEQFMSGAFGGKEIALADQQAIVYKHRHALVLALPQAFVAAVTANS
jgi:HK97 family phage major capsid protein